MYYYQIYGTWSWEDDMSPVEWVESSALPLKLVSVASFGQFVASFGRFVASFQPQISLQPEGVRRQMMRQNLA